MRTQKNEFTAWIAISKRQWFSNLWHTRGANFLELQIWKFRISIGMPWKKGYIRQMGMDYIKKANQENLKQRFSLLIKF